MDAEANFQTAKRQITDAAAAGADLAVLPEFHLTSWTPKREGFFAACFASSVYLAKYQDLARELRINVVPGTICEPYTAEGQLATEADIKAEGSTIEWRNMAYFINAGTGDISGAYQKKNLWHSERGHLASSTHEPHTAFDTPFLHADGVTPVRAGFLVCWDLTFPEAFRALIADGADIVIIPSWWYPLDAESDNPRERAGARLNKDAERVFVETATILRAFEGNVAVVFSNAGGSSGVTMPVLGEIVRCGTGEEMKVAEIDLDVLKVAEGMYKIREDLASVGWHYGYEKK